METLTLKEQIKLNSKLKLIENRNESYAAFQYRNKKYYIYKLYFKLYKVLYYLRQSPFQEQISFKFNYIEQAIDYLNKLLEQQLKNQEQLLKEIQKEKRKIVFIKKFKKTLNTSKWDNSFIYQEKKYNFKFHYSENTLSYVAIAQDNKIACKKNSFSSILDHIDTEIFLKNKN
jgi:hypothetical protein